MSKYLSINLFLVIFFLFTKDINAQVVINEVFANPSGSRSEPNEFVELMNISEDQIDLDGYKFQDAAGKEFVIGSLLLGSKGFAVFRREESKIALNNDEDEVELYSAAGELIDSFSYQGTDEDRSWSRYPDGTGDFFGNTEVSEGIANLTPPTSTPVPTAKPTSTPKPTKTPKPSSTPKPTKSNYKSESDAPSDKVLGKSDRSAAIAETVEIEEQDIGTKESEKRAKSDNTRSKIESNNKTDNINGSEYSETPQSKNDLGAGLFFLGGIGFIGAAGFPFIKKKGYKNIFR